MSVHRPFRRSLLRSAMLLAALAAASGLAPARSSASDTSDNAGDFSAIWAQPPASRTITIDGRRVEVSISIFQLDLTTGPDINDRPERINVAVSLQPLDRTDEALNVTATRIRMVRLLGQNTTFRRPLSEITADAGATVREFDLAGAPLVFRANLRLRTTIFLQAGDQEIAVPMGLIRVRDNVVFLRGGLNDVGGTITE